MLNAVVLQGRLGADPEKRETQSGKAVASVDLCCQRAGKDSQPDWLRLVFWEKNAETLCRYFRRGDEILVEGRLQSRNYEDRNGQKRTAVEVVVSRLHFTSGRKREEEEGAQAEESRQPALVELEEDGDLPF